MDTMFFDNLLLSLLEYRTTVWDMLSAYVHAFHHDLIYVNVIFVEILPVLFFQGA